MLHSLQAEENYLDSYNTYKNCDILNNREELGHHFHNAHNDYVLQIRASNRIIEEFQIAIPEVLEVRLYVKCPIILNTKVSDKMAYANSEDPDQTAPGGAVWSGSTLFAIPLSTLRNNSIKIKH